jgi:DNA-binding NtrC family response regulator
LLSKYYLALGVINMRVLWISSDDASAEEARFRAELSMIIFRVASSGSESLDLVKLEFFDSVVLNTPVPGWASDELLEELRRTKPEVPVFIRAEAADLGEAVRMTKLGAFHFVSRSTSAGELRTLLEMARDFSRASRPELGRGSTADEPWREFLIGRSSAVQVLVDNIRLLGPRKCTILITGETGTGKEVVARALHMASNRAQNPLVALNCSALPDNLLEAELFGHVKGAFTGAVAQRAGRFEQANRGTLFLDEIADIPLEVQTKLLRVLQEREFQRLGSSDTVKVDVRVIAACNVDLGERARAGRFRDDLYYRLNVIPIEVPPLRDRLEDVPVLVSHFVEKIARAENLPVKRVTRETLDRLMRYQWPGNIRQLENTVEMAMILSGDRDVLFPSDFRLPAEGIRRSNVTMMPPIAVPDHGLDFEQTVGAIERNILEQALQKTNGNKKQAAEMLGLKRTTLSAKLKSLESLAG